MLLVERVDIALGLLDCQAEEFEKSLEFPPVEDLDLPSSSAPPIGNPGMWV